MCRRSTCLSSRGALRQQRQQGPANTGGANSDYETGTHADCYDWPAVLLGATNGATLGASLAVKHPASPRCEHGNWCAFRRCICSGKTRPASWGSSSGVLWRSAYFTTAQLSTAILRKNLVHFGWPQFVISEQALQTLLLRVGWNGVASAVKTC